MKTITLPSLYCPWRPRINPHVNAVSNHTDNWVKQFGLFNEESFKSYQAANFAYLTARFYPTATPERLDLANDLNTLLFCLDDAMDNQVIKSDITGTRHHFEQFIHACLSILEQRNVRPQSGETAVFAGLKDVWSRLLPISSELWQTCFIRDIRLMFDTALWEFDNVSNSKFPSVASFYAKRQYLGAAHIATTLIPVIEGLEVPEKILQHPTIHDLTVIARNAIVFANDLYSLSKELDHGDNHNMVLVLREERDLSLDAAISQTAMLHNNEVFRFEKHSKELPSFGAYDPDIRRYVQVLSAMVRGNIDWSEKETKRYERITN